jgi:NAD-dependent deacetylase
LQAARSVVVLSGSGMSAESGIPTFRDAQTGLWSKYRPEDLATPQAFSEHPRRVWEWYQSRHEGMLKARPHAGHEALVLLESLVDELTIVTQNVDGLHQRSGSARVLELHGNILRSVCSVTRKPIDEDYLAQSADVPPRSPHAPDGLARPDVVWFGELLPEGVFEQAAAAVRDCDACIVAGTSAQVQPAAFLPLLAKEGGALLIEINPASTPLSDHADYTLRAPASVALPAVVRL